MIQKTDERFVYRMGILSREKGPPALEQITGPALPRSS